MIENLCKTHNITITQIDDEYIDIAPGRKARGAFRWCFTDKSGEIVLAKSADEYTLCHEVGHALNYVLGDGKRKSDQLGIDSEEFADIIADVLQMCYNLK
jgi:hypothetical protein